MIAPSEMHWAKGADVIIKSNIYSTTIDSRESDSTSSTCWSKKPKPNQIQKSTAYLYSNSSRGNLDTIITRCRDQYGERLTIDANCFAVLNALIPIGFPRFNPMMIWISQYLESVFGQFSTS